MSFPALRATKVVSRRAPKDGWVKDEGSFKSTGWAEVREEPDTCSVAVESSGGSQLYPTKAAALDAATIENAIKLLENERRPEEAMAYVVASAPDATDDLERAALIERVAKQISIKLKNAGLDQRVLRVLERRGGALHGNFVFCFPVDRWHLLDRLSTQAEVARFDLSDGRGLAVHVQAADDTRGGVLGLARYLAKELPDRMPLPLGGSRVVLSRQLAHDMAAIGFQLPDRRYARRSSTPPG